MARPALRLREAFLILCIFLLSCLLFLTNVAYHRSAPSDTPRPVVTLTCPDCPSCLIVEDAFEKPRLGDRAQKKEDAAIEASAPEAPYILRVNVFTFNRVDGLKRLLKSLVNSYYPGVVPSTAQLPMTIYFDMPKKESLKEVDSTREFLDSFHWPYGPLVIHRRERNVGLRTNIMESWYPVGNGGKLEDLKEYAAFFEDDIEVSPYWFIWSDKGIRTYSSAFVGVTEANSKLLGLSLYRCVKDEQSGKMVNFPDNEPFLLQQPSSWGAVYFPTHWKNFRVWFQSLGPNSNIRVFDLNDPSIEPSSNTWPSATSWKKYLIFLMYHQGWYMVYPNLPDRTVLSTSHLMKGVHPTPQRDLFELPIFPTEGLVPPEELERVDSNDPLAKSPTLAQILMKHPPLEAMTAYDVMHRTRGRGPKVMPNFGAEFPEKTHGHPRHEREH